MTHAENDITALSERPKRADARRNHDKLIAAAREAFAECGTTASLEDVARRAGVGIGTLYRHFPTRQDLLEAVYVDEFEAISRSADDLADLPPWDALVSWLQQFVRYAATKRALAEELLAYIDIDSDVFRRSREAITAAGEPLLERAQRAGVARPGRELRRCDAHDRRNRCDPRIRSRADRAHPRARARWPALPGAERLSFRPASAPHPRGHAR